MDWDLHGAGVRAHDHPGRRQTVAYALLRWTTADLSHTDDQPEEHLPGSFEVQPGRQDITLRFVYSGPGTPLPGTALPVGG